jgi:glycosyltransferase 2 family protein
VSEQSLDPIPLNTISLSASEGESETDTKPLSPKQRVSKALKSALKLIVSIALLGLMLHLAGAENTFSRLAHANLWYLPIGVLLYLGSQAISTYRWSFLAHALDFFLPFGELYRSYLIGMFFNMFLPGSIGGDGVRLLWLAKRCNRKKREALLTLLAERGVGLVALLILTSLISLLPVLQTINLAIPLKIPTMGTLSFNLRVLLLGLSSFLFIGYISLYILPLERLDKRFPFIKLLEQASVYWKSPNLLFKSVSISLFVHALMIAIHYMIALALNINITPTLLIPYLAVTYGVVSLASVLPISANGFGVREGIYWLLLTRLGISGETALAFAFYWDAVTLLTAIPGGILLLLRPKLQTQP